MDRQTAAFKEELRSADLLLIDDVHFVAGKTSRARKSCSIP